MRGEGGENNVRYVNDGLHFMWAHPAATKQTRLISGVGTSLFFPLYSSVTQSDVTMLLRHRMSLVSSNHHRSFTLLPSDSSAKKLMNRFSPCFDLCHVSGNDFSTFVLTMYVEV